MGDTWRQTGDRRYGQDHSLKRLGQNMGLKGGPWDAVVLKARSGRQRLRKYPVSIQLSPTALLFTYVEATVRFCVDADGGPGI